MQNDLCGIFVVPTIVWGCCCCVERKKKEEEEEEVLQQTKRGVRDVPDAVQRTTSVCLDPLRFLFLLCWEGGFQAAPKAIILIN
jgi:hypothetical protein